MEIIVEKWPSHFENPVVLRKMSTLKNPAAAKGLTFNPLWYK